MKICNAVAFLAFSVLCGGPSATAQPMPAPAWSVKYDCKQCIMWRDYAKGNPVTRLGIKPSLTGDATRIYVVYRGPRGVNRWVKGYLQVGGGQQLPVDFIDFPTAHGERFIKLDLPSATVATAMKASLWKMGGQRLKEFQLPLDGLPSAMPVLERCVADRLAQLGLDEASLSRIAEPPLTDLMKYFSSGDYPVLANNLGISGKTQVRLLVGSDGRVLECYVKQGSGNALLDYVTCETFEKDVKFSPAKDVAGNAVASITTQTIAWQAGSDK